MLLVFGSPSLSFNPCYYGIGFRRNNTKGGLSMQTSFNPCYYGIGFRRNNNQDCGISGHSVSILVIMELALEVYSIAFEASYKRFQSLLLWNWL